MRTSLTAGRLIRPARGRAEGDCRRDGQNPAVLASDNLPAAFVHHPVMPVAEQSEVGRFISTAMEPVHEVGARAPACWALTTSPCACFVAPLCAPPHRP